MNDLDLYLQFVSSTLNISETGKDRGLVPKDHE